MLGGGGGGLALQKSGLDMGKERAQCRAMPAIAGLHKRQSRIWSRGWHERARWATAGIAQPLKLMPRRCEWITAWQVVGDAQLR